MGKAIHANIISLGCSKNTVDSEKLAWQLRQAGWQVEHEAEKLDHTHVFINTCGFILDAKEESVNTILDIIEAKKAGYVKEITVFGCLVERYRVELQKEMPEVDHWIGNYSGDRLLPVLQLEARRSHARIQAGPAHYAYLKIAEGCDRRCAYCAIPLIKGPYISRPERDILEEARYLGKNGVKELLMIAQDLSYYGIDTSKSARLPELSRKLCNIPEIQWIRYHYLYPANFPMEILDMMQNEAKICRYLDIPLQHISDRILKKMQRAANRKKIEEILQAAREKVPGIALRTTLMVGYPGETEKEFEALLDFIRTWRFERLGVFTYSEEEGTYAAEAYPDDIPEKVKQERADILMQTQQEISLELNSEKAGSQMTVLIDRREGNTWIGRSEFDSVEVDNEILLHGPDNLAPGDFCLVEITSAGAYELEGKTLKIID